MQELIRHVDPARRTLGQFLRDEICAPLGIEFHIGLPREIPEGRLAELGSLGGLDALRGLPHAPPGFLLRALWPGSLLRKSILFNDVDRNDRAWLEVEVPASNGVGTARAIARAYSVFADGGAELGIAPQALDAIATERAEIRRDAVTGVPSSFSAGFLKPAPRIEFGTTRRAFGAPGAGGSFGFADPDARLGFGYAMNRMDYYIFDDPRERSLRDAVYASIATASSRS
jgi:CubicO group peptidase (beta-lactamase class C family)